MLLRSERSCRLCLLLKRLLSDPVIRLTILDDSTELLRWGQLFLHNRLGLGWRLALKEDRPSSNDRMEEASIKGFTATVAFRLTVASEP